MPQPKKSDKDKAAPHQAAKYTKAQIKKIAKGDKESEFFLPFCSTCIDPCCNGYILATASEHKKIVEYSGEDHFEKHRNYYVHEADTCNYLKGGLCSVHPVRPTICRIYPYYVDGDSGELVKDPTCPAAETMYAQFKPKAQRKVKKLIEEMGWKNFLHFWLS